jgi:hypothetical protein
LNIHAHGALSSFFLVGNANQIMIFRVYVRIFCIQGQRGTTKLEQREYASEELPYIQNEVLLPAKMA